ncbi:MAG TPA: Stp1/IreP family PP2C-type Ser/Thr phosphatase [Chthonomonadaceae bacterium]|nr:Stp1/IreP family PP2C-type Ser/Thr phosphatase [Chthonomonadaceae bacterium]
MSVNDGTGSASVPALDETTAKFDRNDLVRGWRDYEARTPRVVPALKYAAKTDMGQVRENNEDKFDYYEPEDPSLLAARGSLFIVADGIGGAQAGQIASEMLVKSLIAGYYDHPAGDIQTALYETLVATNDRIHSLAQMIPERSGMGSTLTAAVFVEDQAVLAQVGDSRAYLIRDGAIRQVTQDHSWVEEQVRAGMLSREAAEMSPFRNVITRSVGASPTVQPDFYIEETRAGDLWVLCSDGLTGHVGEGEIAQIAGSHPPSEAARQLIELANARGGRDNITVFILSVRDLIPLSEPPATSSNESVRRVPEAPSGEKMAVSPAKEEVAEPARASWRKLFGL